MPIFFYVSKRNILQEECGFQVEYDLNSSRLKIEYKIVIIQHVRHICVIQYINTTFLVLSLQIS